MRYRGVSLGMTALLSYRNLARITIMVIPAGVLYDDPQIKPTDRIFWSSRATWSCDCHDMPTHDEYPEAWFSAPKRNGSK